MPRYSMVMFHRIPYDEVFRRGTEQETLLDELVADVESLEQLDLDRAESLARDRLSVIETRTKVPSL